MQLRIATALAVATLLIPGAIAQTEAGAPLRIQVGDRIVHGAALKPYSNKWSMSLTTAAGKTLEDAGTWSDELTAVTEHGRACFRRTQVAQYKNAKGEVAVVNTTVNVFDRETLAPVLRTFQSHRATGEESSARIDFQPGTLAISTTEKGETKQRAASAPAAFDYYGGVYALMWAAMPLRQGFAASYPSYMEDDKPENVTWTTMKVVGREKVEAGTGRTVDAWVIESDGAIGSLKYWVTQQKPYIIQMDFKALNGSRWLLKMA